MLVGALALHSKVSALGNEGRPSITGVQGPPAQGAGQLSRERVACRARTVDTQAHVHTHTHTHTNTHTHTWRLRVSPTETDCFWGQSGAPSSAVLG